MSRHDEVLRRAEEWMHDEVLRRAEEGIRHKSTGSPDLVESLVAALKQEIIAHDKTRAQRNDATDSVIALRGNVRGLESKVQLLQKELDDLKNARTNLGATLYHDGYTYGLVVARQAIEALEDD